MILNNFFLSRAINIKGTCFDTEKAVFLNTHMYKHIQKCACIIYTMTGSFHFKNKKKSTRKFPELNAEGFKISSQGGSGRRIKEGKTHDQYLAYKRLLDKKLGKIKLVFYNYL